ncbi:MAG: hypothetical protein RJA11_1763, partial [Bacteroidota bacterium]
MNNFALHISRNIGKLLVGIIGMLLCFHSNAHGMQTNIMQTQSMNIRLKPLKTLDDLQIQLSQSTLPVLSASKFNQILPLPLRIPYTSDQSARLHIKPAYEKLSRTYTMSIPDGISISAVLKVLKNEIELVEILVDGISGSHRFFQDSLGGFYTFMISFIEILSVLAFIGTIAFLARRNMLKLPRLRMKELVGWPTLDANLILVFELILISFIFTMNGADEVLRQQVNQTNGF